MIYVTSRNLGFNAKFVMEKENKEIWESYHKIVLPVMELDSPNQDMELINLEWDLEDLVYLDLICMALIIWWDHIIWLVVHIMDQDLEGLDMELTLHITKILNTESDAWATEDVRFCSIDEEAVLDDRQPARR